MKKKTDKFEWTEEANEAFKRLKAYLTSSPVLTPSKKYEDMMLYIAATTTMISTAIVIEREEEGRVYKVQCPVYYISEVLSESKIWYPHVQKILYALLITSRKLRHYFESHKITVVIDFPLGDILHNRDATWHISKWAVELGALNIDFTPRKAIKSQALADFVAEWTEIQKPMSNTILDHWKMYFDGSVQASSSFLQTENNSSTFFRYYGKLQTMKQNTKPSSTGYEWQLPSESSIYSYTTIQQ